MREAKAEKKLRLETAVCESRPDVQDDIQAIDEQQEEEIWIDPGMKAHPVAHLDGLDDDEEEDIEYTVIYSSLLSLCNRLGYERPTPHLF
jgi:hypothetical protein